MRPHLCLVLLLCAGCGSTSPAVESPGDATVPLAAARCEGGLQIELDLVVESTLDGELDSLRGMKTPYAMHTEQRVRASLELGQTDADGRLRAATLVVPEAEAQVVGHGLTPRGGVDAVRRVLPVAGGTYTVHEDAAGFVIADAAGAPPPDDELAEVIELIGQTHCRQPLLQAVSSMGAPTPGARGVTSLPVERTSMFSIDAASLQFVGEREIDGESRVVFAVEATTTREGGGQYPMTGELHVDPSTGWPVSMHLAGSHEETSMQTAGRVSWTHRTDARWTWRVGDPND